MRNIFGGWVIIWGPRQENFSCMLEIVWQPRGYSCQPRHSLSGSGRVLHTNYAPWPSLGLTSALLSAGVQYCHLRDISLTICEGASALLKKKLMLMHVIHHHDLGRDPC